MDENILRKCMNVWTCPDTGNAVIILRRHDRWTNEFQLVEVADLDMGCKRTLMLEELTEAIRPSEEEDYGYSWCVEADAQVVEAVVTRAYA